ncbi:MAG TPA: hypothetical protein VFK60_06085, partial [Casimicrobiaceae bacterium]|nr:hypothetical protein [Casimicrobiaceae bacterium]
MNDDGIGVCPFAVAMAVVGLVPDQLVIVVPQLLAVTVTCPPPLPSDDGDTETEHDGGGVLPPGDVHETTRLPLLG